MTVEEIERLDSKEFILIKGARMHNLKNIDIALPRNKFIVITGLSGSGKSTLAFDTLYAEGQRRYVESLSSYARQFLGRFDKPQVDYIKGISPAIAIEQKVNTRNTRSTVGTSTEIYDYLKLLYARIGKTYSPISGKEVKRDTIKDVINYTLSQEATLRAMISCIVQIKESEEIKDRLQILQQQGFSRILVGGEAQSIEEVKPSAIDKSEGIELLVDRFSLSDDEDNRNRISDSIQTAFFEGKGSCTIYLYEGTALKEKKQFSNLFELDGMQFSEPDVHFFSFNNPIGACPRCEGFGNIIGIDKDLVIPDKSLSIFEDAIVCWKGDKMQEWKESLIYNAQKFDFPIHRPYFDLTLKEKQLLWDGNKYFDGLNKFFSYLESNSYKIQYRVMLSRYRGKTTCPDCRGTRLRKDADYVKFCGKSISELVDYSVSNLAKFFENISLTPYEEKVGKRLLIEIKNRLRFLDDVGLGYLTLNRNSATLSGGESQRINLATSLGSSLVGSMYILDEPSIGLHSRDTERLIGVLKALRDLGNTLIVVEHDEDIMKEADYIVDLGPEAGSLGGHIVFEGVHEELIYQQKSLTAKYLTGIEKIEVPSKRRTWNKSVKIIGARQHNLKNIDVEFPLQTLTVVSGVSGSGKTSLVNKILYPALKKMFAGYSEETGDFTKLEGDIKAIENVEFIDQNPIGKSSRSNPVTYVKAYDEIRSLFANLKISKAKGLKPSHFSFNVEGGRCDSCSGEGYVTVEMQFMADIQLKCESCNGQRFKDSILEVTYNGKNINDLLQMTIDDAIDFFQENIKENVVKKIIDKLKPLQEVGLGYVQMGQSSSTLSGGEAQRIKLASYLIKGSNHEKTLFIFDEPTTGLHFHDIKKLLKSFSALIALGHSLVVIEHNMEIIKCADWIIDLGPEGGENGGYLMFSGIPEDLVNHPKSVTAPYLKEKLI